MKRIVALSLGIILWMGLFQPGFAADALHRMLQGEQDVVVLGEIIGQQDRLLHLRVIRAFQGKPSGETIQIMDDFVYAGFSEASGRPQVGDYGVLSLNRTGEVYQQAWYMARADSGHMRALSLYYDPAAGPGPPDLKALQYYINTNGRQTDFYFEGDQVFARRSLLRDVDLTDGLVPWTPDIDASLSGGTDSENTDREEPAGGFTLANTLSALMLAFFAVVMYIRIRGVFITAKRQK